jgi:hypothetical protein
MTDLIGLSKISLSLSEDSSSGIQGEITKLVIEGNLTQKLKVKRRIRKAA